MTKILDNSIVKSAIKAVKYPLFASLVPVVLEWITKLTDIEVVIPGLDNEVIVGALFSVAGAIFIYDVLKHSLGLKLP